jgi:periplasmic protein TonB
MPTMSYANHGSGRERIVAIGLVGLIQGGIIAALVSGLAVTFTTTLSDVPLSTYDVPPDPVPPPPDIKPPEAAQPLATTAIPAPLPKAPTPIVPLSQPTTTVMTTDLPFTPMIESAQPPLPPAPPPAPPADLTRAAAARGNVGDWFPRSDYPASALRAGTEGRVSVLLTISPAGRATGCEVVSTSGDSALDAATCRLALRNGRFEPGRGTDGAKVATRLRLPPVVWRIEN